MNYLEISGPLLTSKEAASGDSVLKDLCLRRVDHEKRNVSPIGEHRELSQVLIRGVSVGTGVLSQVALLVSVAVHGCVSDTNSQCFERITQQTIANMTNVIASSLSVRISPF